MRIPLCLLLALALLWTPLAVAGEDDAQLKEELAGLSGAKALELVAELADDKMKGRKTAFEGGSLVENWMLAKMSEFGLHPSDAGGTYLEPFGFAASNTKAPIELKIAGKALAYGTDYFDLNYSGSGTVEAEAIFVGYGIARADAGWDDYAGLDVKGKIVIAIRGAPKARASEFKTEGYIGYKSATAADKGAAGFLLVQGEAASTGTIQNRFRRGKLPALWMSGKVADTIFAGQKTTLAALKKSRDEGKPGKGFATGVKIQMEVHADYVPRAKGHNALGSIKGRDPDLKDEIILVGAHMDHLGVGPDGQVFNGADDNASGTAVMIHLADILTANRFRPKRTVIFCGFGAEEQGLWGSKALAARYPFQGEIVAVLNMDMMGQGEPVVAVNGGGSYPTMQALIEKLLPASVKKQTSFGLRTGPFSDHWPFHERGIPSFAISTKGKHPHYHTPKDDTEIIKAACLEAAARVVGSILVKLATYEKPLADPNGMAEYLLNEGPRLGLAWHAQGKLQTYDKKLKAFHEFDLDEHGRAEGLAGVVVRVPESEDPAAAWTALEHLASQKGSPYVLARRAADVGHAWNQGKFVLLPAACCAGVASKAPASLSSLAKIGYRLLMPWRSCTDDKHATGDVAAVIAACRQAGVLPDLSGLATEHWPAARKALGTMPATYSGTLHAWVKLGASQRLLGPSVLPVVLGAPDALQLTAPDVDGPAIPVVLGRYPLDRLAAWTKKQPAGWDLPGSKQRKAIRGALGGNLLTWLARSER